MGLRYTKNMFVLKVYQQTELYFYRISGFVCNNVYLQKHIMVIRFWCKYKTIIYFLHGQGSLIYFRFINIMHRVFLELLVRVIVESEFFPIHIVDVVFLILKATFLEKFFQLCSLISYLSGCHSVLRQNVYYSLVIILVFVCFQCLVVLLFHQNFLCI